MWAATAGSRGTLPFVDEENLDTARLIELTDLLSAAGQELQLARHAEANALAKVTHLVRDAQGLVPEERIAQLTSLSESAVRDLLADGRDGSG